MSRYVLAMVAVAALGSSARAEVLKVGDRSVELDVAVDRHDKALKLGAYRGRWIVVTVGAEWCAPCKKELPIWDRLAADVRDRITFIALSLDDDRADGRRFHTKLGLAHMVLGYLPAEQSAVAARYGAATMPSTFIIDPQGVVRYVKSGFAQRDPDGEYRAMKATILQLTPAPKPGGKPTTPDPKPDPKPDPASDPKPDPKPEPEPKPRPEPEPEPTPAPELKPTPAADPGSTEVAPFHRGFALEVGIGAALLRADTNRAGFLAHGVAGVALTPSLVAGLRLGVGTASNATSLGSATLGADLDVLAARGFVGGGLGVAVQSAANTDDLGLLAIELRGGVYVRSWGTHHRLCLDLELTRLQHGDASTTMAVVGLVYRHR
ncbi:MAG: TlpA disulfide reductase family protein [Proteobacteria bacterium]|nr:TlpA disulfide reductase family protein [Pseudomonadota bacterium]